MNEVHTEDFAAKPSARLTIVIGLPGSGKSTYMQSLVAQNPDIVVYDDYQGKAYNKDHDPRLSEHFGPLVSDLKRGKSVIVSDIRYCIPHELHSFLAAILSAYPDVQLNFTYFENNPEQCRQNILARNREERLEKELQLLEKLSAGYEVPTVEMIPVYT